MSLLKALFNLDFFVSQRGNMKKIILLLFIVAFPIFVAAQTTGVKIYLQNSRLASNSEDCGKVFPVTRKVAKTKAVARAALDELFKGVTTEEKAKDYSSIFSGKSKSVLLKLNIKNGAAYVNFRKSVRDAASGASSSCGSDAFYAQVEETLKQFPSIKNVFYAIEGKPEDFYSNWMQAGECPKELGKCSGKNFR